MLPWCHSGAMGIYVQSKGLKGLAPGTGSSSREGSRGLMRCKGFKYVYKAQSGRGGWRPGSGAQKAEVEGTRGAQGLR